MKYKIYTNSMTKRKVIFESSSSICEASKHLERYRNIKIDGKLFEMMKFETSEFGPKKYKDEYKLKFGVVYNFFKVDRLNRNTEYSLIIKFYQSQVKNKSMIELYVEEVYNGKTPAIMTITNHSWTMHFEPDLLDLCEKFILKYISLIAKETNPCANCLYSSEYQLYSNCKNQFKNIYAITNDN